MKVTTLPNLLIQNVIKAVDEGLIYQPHYDFSALIQYDIDIHKMNMIETIIHSLRKEPYLTQEELVRHGVSKKFIDSRLGGINNIRELLEIQDYDFTDYLEQNKLNLDQGVKLSYYHYQTFIGDIRNHFRSEEGSVIPIPELRVELSTECAINAIPLLGGKYTLAVPATDFEAVIVAMGLIVEDYDFIRFSKYLPILTIQPRGEKREIDVEVRCLSSQFNQGTQMGICVIDDIGAKQRHPFKEYVFDFPTLLKNNGYTFEP